MPRVQLARITADGELDETFWPGLAAVDGTPQVWDILALDGGGCYVSGHFTSFAGFETRSLVRLHADGRVDETFRSTAVVLEGLALDGEGRVLATDGVTWRRFLTDGQLDPVFEENLMEQGSPTGRKAAVLEDGSILIGRRGLVKLTPEGERDTSLQVDADGGLIDFVPLPGGRVLVSGDFTTTNGVECKLVARLEADGSVDETFELEVPDGVHGLVWRVAPAEHQSTVIGHVTNSFNPPLLKSGDVQGAAVTPDGSVYVYGRFTEVSGVAVENVARLRPDGTVDPDFASRHHCCIVQASP